MQRNQIRTQMPRQSRKKSSTGIYHVMLRGINKQDIFEEEEDYVRMKEILIKLNERRDEQEAHGDGSGEHGIEDFFKYKLPNVYR